MIEIQIRGVDRLIEQLGRLEGKRVLRRPMEQSLELIRAELATYPPKPGPGDWPGFVSEKQRRWFFWALKHPMLSGLRVPYVRTWTLGRRWTKIIEEQPDGLLGVVGNKTSYGPWVQAAEKTPWGTGPQARIHQGRWTTDQQALDMYRATIEGLFEQAIEWAIRAEAGA